MITISETSEGVGFWIHVTPRAKRAAVAGRHGDALRVAVAAPPVAGLANEACVRALARALGVRRSDVVLDPKSRARRKRVRVTGPRAALAARLGELADASGND